MKYIQLFLIGMLSCSFSCNGSEESDEGGEFVTSWKTDNSGLSDDNQITLPLVDVGEYDFNVDWGDGTQDTITVWNDDAKTHTYDSPGTYEVTITGMIKGWSFISSTDFAKILEVKNWGPLGFGNTTGQFLGCIELTISARDTPDLEDTTSLDRAFGYCFSLTQVPSIDQWNVSDISDMSDMFAEVTLSTDNYDALLIGWETQDLQSDIQFSAGHSIYSPGNASEARQRLIDDYGWTIEDGGEV